MGRLESRADVPTGISNPGPEDEFNRLLRGATPEFQPPKRTNVAPPPSPADAVSTPPLPHPQSSPQNYSKGTIEVRSLPPPATQPRNSDWNRNGATDQRALPTIQLGRDFDPRNLEPAPAKAVREPLNINPNNRIEATPGAWMPPVFPEGPLPYYSPNPPGRAELLRSHTEPAPQSSNFFDIFRQNERQPERMESGIVLPDQLPSSAGDPKALSVIVVDKTNHRTHVLQSVNGRVVEVVNIQDAVGAQASESPSERRVVKQVTWNPVWVPTWEMDHSQTPVTPFSENPGNPLGIARMRLTGEGAFALHGTSNPESIGKSVSHGCIRHRNEDVAVLMQFAKVGTPVYFSDNLGGTQIRAEDFTRARAPE